MHDTIESIYSLSALQQGLLFHCVSQPDSTQYFIQARLELCGELNLQAFEAAWLDMLQRHSILRTAFVWEGLDTPMQVVQRQAQLPLSIEDWQDQDESALTALLEQDARAGFNLEQAPLMRLRLLQMGPQRWQLLWSYHHLLLDGWSISLLMSEWINRYCHHDGQDTAPLPPPTAFADYIAWLDQQDEQQAIDFWQSQLRGFTSPTPLPQLDSAFVADAGLPYGEQTLDISETQGQALQQFCRQHGLTLNTLLQAAWGLLLGSLAGRREALFGITVSGRPDSLAGAGTMVGLFINTLPLRLQWQDDINVGDWLKQLHMLNGDLRQFEHTPLVRLKALSDIAGDASLFDSIFVFENFPFDEEQNALGQQLSLRALEEGILVNGIGQTRGRNSYPLSLIACVENNRLQLLLSYQRQRFSDTSIALLLQHLQQLLHALITQIERPVSALDFSSANDRQQQMHWGSGQPLPLAMQSIGDKFAHIVAAFPEREAVGDADTALSYAQLDNNANQLAWELLSQGLQPGDTLALALPRSVDMIVAVVAALKAGLTYVPLDYKQPHARLLAIIADSNAPAVLLNSLEPAFVNAVTCNTGTANIKLLALDERREQINRQPATAPASAPADATAYLIYTSGSTGTPKGVAVSHRAVLTYTMGILSTLSLPNPCRFATVSTLAADLGNTQLFAALLSGGYLHIVDDNTRFDPAALACLFEQQQIDLLKLTPGQLQGLLAARADNNLLPRHTLLLGGEALDKKLAEQIYTLAPDLAVYNHYGPSEATVGVLLHPINPALDCRAEAASQLPLGRPLPNRQIRILGENGQALPTGVPGELYLGGEGLANGYHQRPELTDAHFVYPDNTSERFYRSGDRARWLCDGRVQFLGRTDHQVKIRGYRVELGEVAQQLKQMSDTIRQAVVHYWQETTHRKQQTPGVTEPAAKLVAYVVADGDINSHKLRHDLAQQLPDYMLPDAVIQLDRIPVTNNGKIDYKNLPAPASNTQQAQDQVPPRTQTEIRLARIWCELLQLNAIGVHDNFFALGGDSIMLLQVIARSRQQGLALTPELAFKYRNLASLAAALDGDHSHSTHCGTIEQAAALPWSPGQQHRLATEASAPLWCLLQPADKHLSGSSRDNSSWRDASSCDSSVHDLLKNGLSEHDSSQNNLFQNNLSEHGCQNRRPFVELDRHLLANALSHLQHHYYPFSLQQNAQGQWTQYPDDKSATVPVIAVTDTDMQTPQVLAATLFKRMQTSVTPWLGAAISDNYLLLCAHPLALDSAAWPVLLDDLTRLYQQIPDAPPELASSAHLVRRYLDYQQERASSENLEPAWEYWLEYAGLELPGPPLPPRTTTTPLPLTHAMQTAIGEQTQRHLITPVSLVTSAIASLLSGQQNNDTLCLAISAGRPDLSTLPASASASQAGVDASTLVAALDFPAPVIFHGLTGDALHDWQHVTAQLKTLPQCGADYGLLRYLSDNQYLREPLLTLPLPQVWVRWQGDWKSQTALGNLVQYQDNAGGDIALIVSVYRLDGLLHIDVNAPPSWAQQLSEHLAALLTAINASEPALDTAFPLCPDASVLNTLPLQWQQVEDIYPLTPMQHAMVVQSLRAGQADYLSQTRLQWDGPLNRYALAQAWQHLLNHHQVLRTIFLWRDIEQPLQCVMRECHQAFFWHDLSEQSKDHQQHSITMHQIQERAEPLSLEHPPLAWLRVFQLSSNQFILCFSIHHALSDGWSFGLLLDQLLQCYSAIQKNSIPTLAPTRPFQHYLRWLHNQPTNQARMFWQQTLDGFETVTPLPFSENNLQPGSDSDNRVLQHQLVLDVDDTRRLEQFCKQQQITTNTLVQAAWALLLARFNDCQDVLFGITVAGRPTDLPGAGTMCGLFIQTLPLRVSIDEQATLHDWLQCLLNHNLTLRQHGHLPLTDIQHCSQVGPGQALFDCVMVFANAPMNDSVSSQLADCRIDFIDDCVQTQYPLMIDVLPGSRLALQFTVAPERFCPENIDNVINLMQKLLRALPRKAPTTRLCEITLLSEQDTQQLAAFNQTANDFADCGYPLKQSYPELFARQVTQHSNKVAAVCAGDKFTYRELDLRSNRLSHSLSASGAQPGQLVAIMAARGLPLLTAIIATFKAGAAYMPLDPDLPTARLEQQLVLSESTVLVTSCQYREQADKLATHLHTTQGKVITLCIIEDHWLSGNETAPALQTTPDSLAYVIFTSGSTGIPKGAMVEQRGMLNNMFSNRLSLGLSAKDRVAQTASQAFDISVWQLLAAPLMGATVYILPDEISRDPDALLQALQQHNISLLELVPAQIRVLLNATHEHTQLNSLRWLQSIGEALPAALVCDWLRRFPDIPILNAYGPAECSDNIAWHPVTECPAGVQSTIAIGHPTANNQLYILDSAARQQPIGVPGEICVAGISVGRGYWRDSARTAQVFVEHPFSPGQRFYRTGDIGRRLKDGRIQYIGRKDFQLKLRGQRIEPGEIEACLERLTAVEKAAVILTESQGASCLVAYWQGPKEQAEHTLRDALGQLLPAHMLPSRLIYLRTLPQNRNGKIDRNTLQQKPVEFTSNSNVAARNKTEQQLIDIWKSLLPVKNIGVDDNFFALGGHSLLATQVLTRIRQRLGVSLPITALFQHNTVASLAGALSQAQQSTTQSAADIIAVSRSQPLPLSYAQQRLWFLEQLEGAGSAYNIPVALKLSGPLNRQALQSTMDMLLHRHESLRTGFRLQGDTPRQYIVDKLTMDITFHDLSTLNEDERESKAQQLIDEEAQRPFALEAPPMLRVVLQRLEQQVHILQLTLHHIAADAWSLGILIREFAQGYAAFLTGTTPSLPALPIQYADYAHWQRSEPQQHYLARQLDYWRQTLQGVPPVFNLPHDYPRAQQPDYEGAAITHILPARQVQTLRACAQQHNATLFMVMLNAFNSLLHRVTGHRDFIVGTDIANREHPALENLIGFFVNVLPIRSQLNENENLNQRLATLRDTTLNAYQHQQVPFDTLVELVQPPRLTGVNPLVQVLFVMQNTPQETSDLAGLTLQELEPQGETCKFDLAVFVDEHENGDLSMRWLYRTGLFKADTIAHFTQGFLSLLDFQAEHSEQTLKQWPWQFLQHAPASTGTQGMRKQNKLKRLKNIKPTQISQSPVEQVKTSFLDSSTLLPLIIEPKLSELEPIAWAQQASNWIDEQLHQYGGLLFRGFSLPNAECFEQFAKAIEPDLFGQYGDLPKNTSGNNIYHSTPYPEQQMILYHNESSHLSQWPRKQWFYCEIPARHGGCTPIVDCREVYRQLPADILAPLEKKGLLYVRHFTDKLDVRWQDFFHTDNRQQVETHCRQQGMQWQWLDDNGLRIEQYCPAVTAHPDTGEMAFFNQIQLHHESCLEAEVRDNLKSMFGPDRLPRNVYYGDGTPIKDSVMAKIGQVYEACAVRFDWQQGDVVMLDNMLIAHARDPFEGTRKICVAMGPIYQRDNTKAASNNQ